ncbi:MAG: FAD-dependent oxidoreductase [Deltaproteobacteria bacterium]
MDPHITVIIGAGPAGLTAAYELSKLKRQSLVLEEQNTVGGLARTEGYKGFYFDLGGHRFFTKAKAVESIWREVLGADFLRRPRLSRIYYNRKFFYYPLKPLNALSGLGLWRSLLIGLSYLRWQLLPHRREETFEQWVTNRFGRRLFETFFKAYTEKVWGLSCSELRAEWAAQRIRGLSLKTVVISMFAKPNQTIKTLIEEFHYPRLGPGMMWQAVKENIEQDGSVVRLNCKVVAVRHNDTHVESVVVSNNGLSEVIRGSAFVSSIPVNEFVLKLDPPPPANVIRAAEGLRYRGLLVVCLIINEADLFPDNWIYIHDPEVRVGRIQNYKNWSPDMVPDSGKTSLGMEYFCTPGDGLWTLSDADLIMLGQSEIERIGLAPAAKVEDAHVIRVPHAYPVYDAEYSDNIALIRQFLDGLKNFQTIGRNGLHRYNNQDHAMMTGLLAARNLALGERNDLWNVNTEPEYHEEALLEEQAVEDALARIFTRLDRVAFGLSLGTVAGAALFLGTLFLAVKGADGMARNLQLLRQYFPGYRVTPLGSVMGFVYAFAGGFISGWSFAFLRNATMFLYMAWLERKAQRGLMRRIFDFL